MSSPTPASIRSVCITVRPRDGITDATIAGFKKWLLAQDYSVSVLEMEHEARHLHAQIWFNEPKHRGDICKAVNRICERSIKGWDDAQKKVLRSGVKRAYSDWYLDYLTDNENKTETPNIITNQPPDSTTDFYATEEEQEKLQTLIKSIDPRMTSLEQKFHEANPLNNSLNAVARFLATEMFQNRTIKCIVQQRDRTALCTTLHAYINRSTNIEYFITPDPKHKALLQTYEAMFAE